MEFVITVITVITVICNNCNEIEELYFQLAAEMEDNTNRLTSSKGTVQQWKQAYKDARQVLFSRICVKLKSK